MWTKTITLLIAGCLSMLALGALPASAHGSTAIVVQATDDGPRCYILFDHVNTGNPLDPAPDPPRYWLETNGHEEGGRPYGIPTGDHELGETGIIPNEVLQDTLNGGETGSGLQTTRTNIGTSENPQWIDPDTELTPDEFATTCLA